MIFVKKTRRPISVICETYNSGHNILELLIIYLNFPVTNKASSLLTLSSMGGGGRGGERPPTSFSPVISTNLGFLVLTHLCKMSRPHLVSVPN